MKTIAIDQSSILISSLMSFIASDKIKSKDAPLSNPDDVAMFSDILISRVSNILCDIAEPGDRVVLCMDKKDGHLKNIMTELFSSRKAKKKVALANMEFAYAVKDLLDADASDKEVMEFLEKHKDLVETLTT